MKDRHAIQLRPESYARPGIVISEPSRLFPSITTLVFHPYDGGKPVPVTEFNRRNFIIEAQS